MCLESSFLADVVAVRRRRGSRRRLVGRDGACFVCGVWRWGLSFYVSEAPVAVAVVSIPKVIVDKLVERGIDVETYVVDM